MNKHFYLLFFAILVVSNSAFSADRYWIATSGALSNWSDDSNWSDASGGVGGFSFPIAGDKVFFDLMGTDDCNLTSATVCDGIEVTGFTGVIDLNSNTLDPVVGGAADCIFAKGIISGTLLSITTSGVLTFSGTTFNIPIDVSGGNVLLNGSIFNNTTKFEKTGAGNDSGSGNNTFVLASEIINNSAGRFELGNGSPDNFQSHLVLNNIGSNRLDIARNSAGNTVDGNLTISNMTTSNGDHVRLSVSAASSLIIGGVSIIENFPVANSHVYVGVNGDVTCLNAVTATNTPTGANGNIIFANGVNSDVEIGTTLLNANLTVNNSGTGNNQRVYVGLSGNITIDGSLFLNNSSTASNSHIYCNHVGTGTYNGNISIENTDALSDGVGFGRSNGSSTLSAGLTVTIGSGGFASGILSFRNFMQIGATVQNITLTGTGRLEHYDSDWGGDVVFIAPRHFFRGTRFRGTTELEKSGGTNDTSLGGNIFDGNTVIRVTGTGHCKSSDTVPNDFDGNATYIQTSTGRCRPTFRCSSTYAGDIIVNRSAGSNIIFGEGNNGRAVLDGTGTQGIYNLNLGNFVTFDDLQTNNANSDITLFAAVRVIEELDLDQGNLISDEINYVLMNNNAIVSSVSNAAFVDGPLEKIGNAAFTFPIGKNGNYRSAGISAPATNAARFRAEYFGDNVVTAVASDSVPDGGAMLHVSNCEYWIIERTVSNDDVAVTLSFDPYNASICSGVSDPSHLLVALWNDDPLALVWENQGAASTTGVTSSGTVTSNLVTTFINRRPFTLASISLGSPLPIALVQFTATNNQSVVDLFWQTASETNNDYFTIERSANGNDFIEIKRQEGAGNSSSMLDYFDVDKAPLNGVSYYRLKQTDFDGEYTYSEIVKVNRKSNSSTRLVVYPNPVSDKINIKTELVNFIINIHSIDGRLINSIENKSTIDMSGYVNGVYNFVILSNGVRHNAIKVVKT